jgi:hypothetical protein
MSENAEILSAINIVKAHLDKDWISAGCYEHQAFGCASCRAVALRKELTLLEDYLIEDDAERAAEDDEASR